jgi:hypothetical protein
VVLQDEKWHQDVDSLLASLRGESPGPTRRGRRWVGAAVALVLVVVGVIAWWQWPGEKKSNQDTVSIAPCVPPNGKGWTSLMLNQDPSGVESVSGGTLRYVVQSATWRALSAGKWQLILKTTMENRTPESAYHSAGRGDVRASGLRRTGRRGFGRTAGRTNQGDRSVRTWPMLSRALAGFRVECRYRAGHGPVWLPRASSRSLPGADQVRREGGQWAPPIRDDGTWVGRIPCRGVHRAHGVSPVQAGHVRSVARRVVHPPLRMRSLGPRV